MPNSTQRSLLSEVAWPGSGLLGEGGSLERKGEGGEGGLEGEVGIQQSPSVGRCRREARRCQGKVYFIQ